MSETAPPLLAAEAPFAKEEFGERFRDCIGIVMPAYNEADGLAELLAEIPPQVEGVPVQVLLVDDGSSDDTAAVAERAGAAVVQLARRQGQGAALRAGYPLLCSAGARVVVTMDADGQHRPEDLPVVVSPVLRGRADLAQGSRRLGSGQSGTPSRRLGLHVFNGLLGLITGRKVTDCANGFRAIRSDRLADLRFTEAQFHGAELLVEVLTRGLRLLEVPVEVASRSHGRSKKPRALRFGLGFGATAIRTWRRSLERRVAPRVVSPQPPARLRFGVVGLWILFTVATSHFRTWANLDATHLAIDDRQYEAIARAAPSLPSTKVSLEAAQRFPIHYAVGWLAHTSALPLHLVYFILSAAVLLGIVLFVDMILKRCKLDLVGYALLMGLLISSPYAFRYHLIAPGLMSDGVFMLGSAILVYGLMGRVSWAVIAGLSIALVGRQSALPLLPLVAIWPLLSPAWKSVGKQQRVAVAVAAPGLAALLYVIIDIASSPFARPYGRSITQTTILHWIESLPGSAGSLAAHFGRAWLGIALPLAALVGSAVAYRVRRSSIAGVYAALCVGVVVAAQGFALAAGHNDLRYAALAIPALIMAAGPMMSSSPARWPVLVLVGIGSLHHSLTSVGPSRPVEFAVLESVVACLLFVAVATTLSPSRGRRASRPLVPTEIGAYDLGPRGSSEN